MINDILDFFGYPPIKYTDPAKDKWLADDKVAHFLGHCAIGLIYTKFKHDPVGGGILSAIWGVQHEYLDSVLGTGASWKDLVANFLGWLTGTVLGLIT